MMVMRIAVTVSVVMPLLIQKLSRTRTMSAAEISTTSPAPTGLSVQPSAPGGTTSKRSPSKPQRVAR
jgi:hypothetical protein